MSSAAVESNMQGTPLQLQRDAETLVQKQLQDAAITQTTTKAGWCLKQGLIHVASVENGRLFDLVHSHGLPLFYQTAKPSCRHESTTSDTASSDNKDTSSNKPPENCFQSLCRIVAGQQLAGKAARAIWCRLLETTSHDLTPQNILSLAGTDGETLESAVQKPAGLSRAKARSIFDLAQRFEAGDITEDFLNNPQSTEEEIRETLLQVRGLGPWSCDMFIMFHLEKPNVFPFGDLGVRKGVAKLFRMKGKGKGGSLCHKKDLDKSMQLVEPYRPYQSLLTYYMWRVADTKDVYAGVDEDTKSKSSETVVTTKAEKNASPPSRKRKARVVTP